MDFKKYLIFACVLLIGHTAIVNHKVVRTVNYEGANTVYNTQIEILNDSPEGGSEIKSYQIALNSSIHQNLIHLQVS